MKKRGLNSQQINKAENFNQYHFDNCNTLWRFLE
jgi:hypothetical protein